LPLGRLWAWPVRLPGVRTLADRAYDAFARDRTTISGWFGLAACGVKPAPAVARSVTTSADPATPVTPLRAWFRQRTPLLRELGAAVVFVVLAAEVLASDPRIPRSLRLDHRPDWMVAVTMYPHLAEAWGLFAPDAPLTDETIYVDAVTRDGRHVDPYNEIASRVATVPIEEVPVRLAQSSFFFDYTLRIPNAGALHQAFIEWILRYPDRTGNPNDAITKLDAYVVEQQSPKPGEVAPTNPHQRRFLQWP
jgi:hypothetical protein